MDDARRFRVNAADCLLAAKTCEPGYREMILSISACWHSLARQDEAMNMLLASWTQTQSSGTQEFAVNTAGGRHAEQAGSDAVQISA
jgi:hypothetical protein